MIRQQVVIVISFVVTLPALITSYEKDIIEHLLIVISVKRYLLTALANEEDYTVVVIIPTLATVFRNEVLQAFTVYPRMLGSLTLNVHDNTNINKKSKMRKLSI